MSPSQLAHREYLKSATWADLRQQVLERDGHKCQSCGNAGTDVHHKTYKRWGHERLSDLVVLCRPCHENWHLTHRNGQRGPTQIGTIKLFRQMKERQRQEIADQFGIAIESLYCAMCITEDEKMLNLAVQIMGFNVWYSQRRTGKRTFIPPGPSVRRIHY